MVSVGLFVRLEAAQGKEAELQEFLTGAQQLAEQESSTTVWYAIKFGPATFGVFDAFEDDSGREAHLNGAIAQALGEHPELFAQPPNIEQVDVLASK